MTKVKVTKAMGGVEDLTLLSAFKVDDNTYAIFDGEKFGSMGLPIIYVSKVASNKLEKINDANEWQSAKNYLKGIINGTNFEYIKVNGEMNADEAYYTPLTLPSESALELIKSHYVVKEDTSSSESTSTPVVPPVSLEPQVNVEVQAETSSIPDIPVISPSPVEEANINPIPPVSDNIPPVPSIPEPVPPVEPIPMPEEQIVEPLSTINSPIPNEIPNIPVTNEINQNNPVNPVMPNNDVASNTVVNTTNNGVIEAPYMATPTINEIPTPPVNPIPPVQNIVTDTLPPVPPLEPINTPVNEVVSPEQPNTPNEIKTNFDNDKETFLKACENMFDALISKYQKQLTELNNRENAIKQKEIEIDQKMRNASEHLANAEAREQVANIAHDNAQKVMDLNNFMPINNDSTQTGVI